MEFLQSHTPWYSPRPIKKMELFWRNNIKCSQVLSHVPEVVEELILDYSTILVEVYLKKQGVKKKHSHDYNQHRVPQFGFSFWNIIKLKGSIRSVNTKIYINDALSVQLALTSHTFLCFPEASYIRVDLVEHQRSGYHRWSCKSIHVYH